MLNDLVCEEYSVAVLLQMPQAEQFAEKWPMFLHLQQVVRDALYIVPELI